MALSKLLELGTRKLLLVFETIVCKLDSIVDFFYQIWLEVHHTLRWLYTHFKQEETLNLIEDLKNVYDIKELGKSKQLSRNGTNESKRWKSFGLSQKKENWRIVQKFHLGVEKTTYLTMLSNYQNRRNKESFFLTILKRSNSLATLWRSSYQLVYLI